jgi:hypothetical protein
MEGRRMSGVTQASLDRGIEPLAIVESTLS